ncbi:MAG TPA: response regulator [Frankiaceae bacterium]|jgi:two-component system chemotaxis response regulator CheY
MTVLIVDDSRVMRQLVTRVLRQAGFGDHTIVEAGNGLEGLEAVAAHRPDVVLSDWNMPECDGESFLHKLRASGDQTPFGFITSEATSGMYERAMEGGAAFLVTKPFTADSIKAALAGVLA